MNREDIIRMAREAGYTVRNIDGDDEVMEGDDYHIHTDELTHFAALVADAEREVCAQIARKELSNCNLLLSYPQQSSAAWNIINAIRARGQSPLVTPRGSMGEEV